MSKFSLLTRRVKGFLRSGNQKAIPGNDAPENDIPAMVSAAERAFFTASAARSRGKEGAIVDLGCWLGATSLALAQGILSHDSSAGERREKVFGFDIFLWEDWMPAHLPYCVYTNGDSFLPEARRLVRDHAGDAVELIQANLAAYDWQGGAIKILLVDAMKNEAIAVHIARTFYPSLLSHALLIHQDFKHYYTSWIHLLQYRLRDYFRFEQSVPHSGTVAFETIKPIPGEAIDQATRFENAADDEIDAAFRYSLALVGAEERTNIAAAHVMHYFHGGRRDAAAGALEMYRRLGLTDKGEFPQVLDLLKQMQ